MMRWTIVVSVLGTLLATGGCLSAEGDVLLAPGGDLGDGCAELSCPSPQPGMATVCGRVIDLETSQPITESPPEVRIVDFTGSIEFAELEVDSCGRFSAQVFGAGLLSVVHTGGIPETGGYRQVASVADIEIGGIQQVTAYALRADTDSRWAQAAGLDDDGFGVQGAQAAIFVDITQPAVAPLQGTPVTGASLVVNGVFSPAQEFYFADEAPEQRSEIVSTAQSTGQNGTGILREGTVATYGGSHPNCTFSEQIVAARIAGVIQVQEITGTCQ
ncbi:MAG: hypothetical protein AAGC55_25585 [Myxococcota bacterium]